MGSRTWRSLAPFRRRSSPDEAEGHLCLADSRPLQPLAAPVFQQNRPFVALQERPSERPGSAEVRPSQSENHDFSRKRRSMVGGGARMLARGNSGRAGEASNDNGNQQTAGASKPPPSPLLQT
jgi:hypothetical protein